MHASVNYVNKGPNDGVLLERRPATIRSNAGILSNGPLGKKSKEILIQMR